MAKTKTQRRLRKPKNRTHRKKINRTYRKRINTNKKVKGGWLTSDILNSFNKTRLSESGGWPSSNNDE